MCQDIHILCDYRSFGLKKIKYISFVQLTSSSINVFFFAFYFVIRGTGIREKETVATRVARVTRAYVFRLDAD